MKRQMFRGVGT